MARKCYQAKYKKRRLKERQNKLARMRRRQLTELEYLGRVKEQRARAEAARLADPRRQLIQRLVNILYARLSANPLYQMMEVAKIFGIDEEEILDAFIRGDDSVPLSPGYGWLKKSGSRRPAQNN